MWRFVANETLQSSVVRRIGVLGGVRWAIKNYCGLPRTLNSLAYSRDGFNHPSGGVK